MYIGVRIDMLLGILWYIQVTVRLEVMEVAERNKQHDYRQVDISNHKFAFC